jgi:hypothetical protein
VKTIKPVRGTHAGGHGDRRISRIRTIAAIVVVGISLGAGLLTTAGAAGATSLNTPMTTDCYHQLGQNVFANRPAVALDGRTTFWEPLVYRYTTSGWVLYASGRLESFSDTALGVLSEQSQSFAVPLNSYYAVLNTIISVGDSRTQAVWGRALHDGAPVGSAVCYT